MIASVYSTLTGKLVGKHPTLGVLVSEDGMVLIPHRWYKCKDGMYRPKQYDWVKGSNAKPYLVCQIKGKTYYVHRLVAEVFLENPDNKPTVDHRDINPKNNHRSNLCWATMTEQNENCSRILNRKDYGVREKDDKNAYARAYGKDYYKRMKSDPDFVNKIRERNRIAMRKRRAKQKAEQSAQPSV